MPTGWQGRLIRAGAPAVLLLLTASHPGYDTHAGQELGRIGRDSGWLPLHIGLLAAFAAFSLSLLAWPTAGGWLHRVRQCGVATSLVGYSAFVGVDGVAAGLLAQAAAGAPAGPRAGLAAGVGALFTSGVVRALALTGAAGWVVAAIAVAAELAASPRLMVPCGLLVAGAVALAFSHAPPAGPAGAGLVLAAALLLAVMRADRAA